MLLNRFKNIFARKAETSINVKDIPDNKLFLEAAMRSQQPSMKLEKEAKLYRVKTLDDWKFAIACATDPEHPDRQYLDRLYENIRLDMHLMSVIDSRILKVQRSKFVVWKGDQPDPEATELLRTAWFEDILYHVMYSKFFGTQLIELWDTDAKKGIQKVNIIPQRYFKADRGIITKYPGDWEVDNWHWNYKEGELENFYLQAGDDASLGMVHEIIPVVMFKKQAFGAWLDFIEKFGVPPRWVTTDREDTKRLNELFDMMKAMMSNHFAVLRGNEQIQIAQTPHNDAHNVFNEFISRANSEISKRIMGQDGTTDSGENTGTYGSLKVLQEVADDRHESDKVFVKNVINKQLLPKLAKLSSLYQGFENLTFEWDESDEMSRQELIESIAKLAPHFDLDTEYLTEKTGIPMQPKSIQPNSDGGADEKK